MKSNVRWPAEWETQQAVWLSWPSSDKTWDKDLAKQWKAFAPLAEAISNHTPVWINISDKFHQELHSFLSTQGLDLTRITLYPIPTNDVWCRDHGATFVQNIETKKLEAVDFRFNAWGGKFPPWDLDDAASEKMANQLGINTRRSDLFLEGGAIEGNGAGSLITTEAVALNENRNPNLSKAAVEQELVRLLGVEQIIWLPAGIEGDDTDGHVDDFCRFTNENTLLLAKADKNSPDGYPLERANEILREQSTFDIIRLPMPEPIKLANWRLPSLPASYANFLISNDLVLVPTFAQKSDSTALGIIQELFPDHQVKGLDSRFFVQEGGAIHCLTQQVPDFF